MSYNEKEYLQFDIVSNMMKFIRHEGSEQ